MKRFTIAVVFIASFFFVSAQSNSISIIPQPVSLQEGSGFFNLKNTTRIEIDVSSEDVKRVAGFLSKKLSAATGFSIPVKTVASSHTNGAIKMSLLKDASIQTEGYKLNVSVAGVNITANSGAGLFYGMQTLLQLMP